MGVVLACSFLFAASRHWPTDFYGLSANIGHAVRYLDQASAAAVRVFSTPTRGCQAEDKKNKSHAQQIERAARLRRGA